MLYFGTSDDSRASDDSSDDSEVLRKKMFKSAKYVRVN